MIALPLSILALAAGVYLLITVKREFLGKVFEMLAWLVIVLALISIGFQAFKAFSCHGNCNDDKCKVEEKQIIIKDGEGNGGHCNMGNAEMGNGCMASCTMKGDSCVMDQATCEKMMGKEACEKMMKERGSCIMGKEECMKACGGHGNCSMEGNSGGCPMMGGDKKDCGGAKKDCCKKDI